MSAETKRIEMVRLAIDHGINYLDLGYPYDLHQLEQIARTVGEALLDGYREKTKITG